MDPLTHALASYSLQRATFPGIPRAATTAVVLAGMIADADLLSTYFGPSAYLTFDRTYFHSLLAALVFSLLATLPFFFLRPKSPANQISRATIFTAALAAALLHLILDFCQTSGVELLWPFSIRSFALDWIPSLDLWILGILLAGILLPLLAAFFRSRASPKPPSSRPRLVSTLSSAPSPIPAAPAPVCACKPSSTPILPAKPSPKSSFGFPLRAISGGIRPSSVCSTCLPPR